MSLEGGVSQPQETSAPSLQMQQNSNEGMLQHLGAPVPSDSSAAMPLLVIFPSPGAREAPEQHEGVSQSDGGSLTHTGHIRHVMTAHQLLHRHGRYFMWVRVTGFFTDMASCLGLSGWLLHRHSMCPAWVREAGSFTDTACVPLGSERLAPSQT